jgi:hypothetical protein
MIDRMDTPSVADMSDNHPNPMGILFTVRLGTIGKNRLKEFYRKEQEGVMSSG